MAHEVEIDPELIGQEFAHLELSEADRERQATAAAEKPADSDPLAWEQDCIDGVEMLSNWLVPAWELSEKERRNIAVPAARLLDRWLPGGRFGFDNWHPAWQVLIACAGVSLLRFDFHEKRFRPTHGKSKNDERERDDNGDNRSESVGQDN